MSTLIAELQQIISDVVSPLVRREVRGALQEFLGSPAQTPDDNPMLTANQAARYLDVSLQSIYRFSSRGVISCYGSGKRIYFKRQDLDAWLQQKRGRSANEAARQVDALLANRRRK
jgi:excisionase family DNA binding protein